jgi:hypothetical protein
MAFIIGTSSSNTQILAAGTTAQRPASPSAGQLRYNSSDNSFEVYVGNGWSQFAQGFGAYTTSNLLIHYDFSNTSCYSGSGSSISDLSGTQGGTITGATFGGTNLAKYLSFTASGTTYVQMGSSIPAGQSTSALSVEAWIYITGLGGTNASEGIGGIISSQNDVAGFRGASINTDTRTAHGGGPNGYHPQIGNGSAWATGYYQTAANTGAISNRWDHVVMTWSNGNPVRVYENGSVLSAGSTAAWNASIAWSSTYWALGRQLSNSGYPRAYTGYIAIARIYNSALSDSEVLYNYNGQKSRFGL